MSRKRPQRERGHRRNRIHAERVEDMRRRLRTRWPFAQDGAQRRAAEAIVAGDALHVYVIPTADPTAPRIQVGGEEPAESNISGRALVRILGVQ